MIKIYSDKTNKYYPTVEEANKAEAALIEKEKIEQAMRAQKEKEAQAKREKLANERKERAAAVEADRKAMVAAQKKYRDSLDAFVKDYGTYHFSTASVDDFPTLFDTMLSFF